MKVYLLGLMPDIPDYRLDSVARNGRTAQCVIAASDSQTARDHMTVEFGMASPRAPHGRIYVCAWQDENAAYCRELTGPVRTQPRSFIRHGVDVAKWSIDQIEYRGILGGRSRMVWWPCAPGEKYVPEVAQ
jgi:hypothetical protein